MKLPFKTTVPNRSGTNRKLFRARGERGADTLGTGCPKTPLLPWSQVTDSVCPEFPVLDAHKESFLGNARSVRPFSLNPSTA
jgi:hypothetical protein